MSNRLKQEKSPYLMQHGENPVDWYVFTPEEVKAVLGEADGAEFCRLYDITS